MKISEAIDLLLLITKWPIALFSFLTLPVAFVSFFDVISFTASKLETDFIWFMFGLFVYTFLWLIFFRRNIFGSFLSSSEHEITHMLFCWLTFHKVEGLSATWNSGGHIRYYGRGNFLISLSPYFWPTTSVFIALAIYYLSVNPLLYFFFGVSVSFQITSTLIEFHLSQTDIIKSGKLFTFIFLPTANLLSYLLVFALAFGGFDDTIWIQYLNQWIIFLNYFLV